MENIQIIFDLISGHCENCKNMIVLKGLDLISSGREFSFHGVKGHVRCDECGYLNNIKVDIKGEITSKGFVCGSCEKKCKKMFDEYFCKDCWNNKLNEEISYHKKQLEKYDKQRRNMKEGGKKR